MNAVLCVLVCFLVSGLQRFTHSLNHTTVSGSLAPNTVDSERIHPDDIRCFCNLPQCVSTGYMCRTSRSHIDFGCFSEIREPSALLPTRHGCLELLQNFNRHAQCDNIPRKHVVKSLSKSDVSTDMLLLCCQKDMCNHVDIPENNKMHAVEQAGLSVPNHFQSAEINARMNVPIQSQPGMSNNDDWFRVATIAVPICGAVILFSLIATAIKILRSERITSSSLKLDNSNELSRKLRLSDGPQNLKRSPHFSRFCGNNQTSTNSCDKKNETRAKINQLINIEYSLLPQSCTDPMVKPNNIESSSNINKNINLSLEPSSKSKDSSSKIYDKEVLSPITVNWSDDSPKSYNI